MLNVDGPNAIIEGFRDRRSIPGEPAARRLLKEYARADCQLENILVELKQQFSGDMEAWLNLERQLVAFGNSGGGIIIYGLTKNYERVGLASSLTSHFDPANVMQKLQRHAPQAQIPTAYVELLYYKKRYGVLLIGKSSNVTVFDKIGNVQLAGGKQKNVFQPGVIYVRVEGATREARQFDLDRLVNDRMSIGLSAFLARIERVAALPPSSELLARSPGANRAYVLVAGGQGIPVTVTQQDDVAVQLTEVLTPEAPLSSLDAEVVGQLRQWHADEVHRVARATLMRWYLGRTTFTPIAERAKFCFLSALQDWGYPMYWASQMDRAELEQVIRQQVEGKVYPDNRVAVYVIGAFFFSRRNELLDVLAPYLPGALNNIVRRLRESTDVKSYLTSGRIGMTVVRVGATSHELPVVMEERMTTGQMLFDQLMGCHTGGNVPEHQRNAAHQLDLLVHGDLGS